MTAPQKTRIDWGAAKAFYIGLPPTERSFARVAREFPVSSKTVRKHAHDDGWIEAAADADRQANEAAIRKAVRSRSERVANSLRFVDDFLDVAKAKLKAGDLDVRASDVPPLVKLAELLEGEATDRIQVGEVRALIVQVTIAAGKWVTSPLPPEERRKGFMGELGELTSGLGDVSGETAK